MKPRKLVDGVCMSSATLIFLGGRLRYLSDLSQFGVHQFSFRDPTPEDVGRSQILSSKIARFIADMGVDAEFLELSSSIDGGAIQHIGHDELKRLGVITGGITDVTWTAHARSGTIYVRGERESLFGHHKIILGFEKSIGFYVLAVIESQGREDEMSRMPLVELVIGTSEERVIDVSARAARVVAGIYTNVSTPGFKIRSSGVGEQQWLRVTLQMVAGRGGILRDRTRVY